MHTVFSQLLLMALITTSVEGGQKVSRLDPESSPSLSPVTESIHLLKTNSGRYPLTNLTVLENAFRNQTSNIQVLITGRVTAVLSDDTDGSRHQRFIMRLANSQTVLVAHNIDLAPRVSGLRVGDTLYVYGEYEWNSQGGVIHWTHHDPNRRHVDGWIERNGIVFR